MQRLKGKSGKSAQFPASALNNQNGLPPAKEAGDRRREEDAGATDIRPVFQKRVRTDVRVGGF